MKTGKRKQAAGDSAAGSGSTSDGRNTRRRRRIVRAVAGAVIGGAIAGPLGVAAGAIVGASRKRGPVRRKLSKTAPKGKAGPRRGSKTRRRSAVDIYPPIP